MNHLHRDHERCQKCYANLFQPDPAPTDVSNWYWRNPCRKGNTLIGVTYGNGTFVTVGARGTILTSIDGSNWVVRNSGTSTNINAVTYGNNTFVAVRR